MNSSTAERCGSGVAVTVMLSAEPGVEASGADAAHAAAVVVARAKRTGQTRIDDPRLGLL